MEKEYSEIYFKCPKGDHTFTLKELIDNNSTEFNKYINLQSEQKVLEKEKEVEDKLTNIFEEKNLKDKEILKANITAEFTEKLNKVETQLKEKETQLKGVQELTKAEAAKEYNHQIAELKLSIEKLHAKAEKDLNIQKTSYDSQINLLNLEVQKKLSEIEKIKENQTAILEANKKEIEKDYGSQISNLKLELEKLSTKSNNDLNAQKNAYNEQINSLNLEVQKKLSEIEKIKENQTAILEANKKEVEKSFLEQKAKLEKDYLEKANKEKEVLLKEIETLKVKNAEHKAIQNKTLGENLEFAVSDELHKAFDNTTKDKIEKANISIKGSKPDYFQIVRNNEGIEIGKIVYEVKNAEWKDSWIPKLSTDLANNKTKYGILVASSFNSKYQLSSGFIKSDEYDNIWICDPHSFIFVSQMIRKLIEIEYKYNQETQRLLNHTNDDLLKEYEQKITNIKKYMEEELPKITKSFNKQLSDISKVQRSLESNSNILEKSVNMLQKQFQKNIVKALEKITGQYLGTLENPTTDDVADKVEEQMTAVLD